MEDGRMQGRVSKQQGSRRKTRSCSERVTRAMQDRNSTPPAELSQAGTSVHPTESGAGPSTTADPAQAEIENVKKVVAKGAGI